jgi:hypothetical protein
MRNMSPIEPGTRFGRLTVISREYPTNPKYPRYVCQCDCGTRTAVTTGNLRNLKTNSCGCIKRAVTGRLNLKHGMSHTVEFKAWFEMIERCRNPSNQRYADWGGRGISVCERWIDSFQSFYDDMGQKTSPRHSLDRIDNDGNYEPSNCRWATAREQRLNQRRMKHRLLPTP